jgi:hypothetical protein
MHGRDDGIDLVVFENLDERLNGGVVGGDKGGADCLLLDLVDL